MHEGVLGTIIPDALVGDGWCYRHHEDFDAVAVTLLGVAVAVTHICVVDNRSAIVAAAVINSPQDVYLFWVVVIVCGGWRSL